MSGLEANIKSQQFPLDKQREVLTFKLFYFYNMLEEHLKQACEIEHRLVFSSSADDTVQA